MVLSTKDGSTSSCCFKSRPPLMRLKTLFLRLLVIVFLIILLDLHMVIARTAVMHIHMPG
ncbi:hypothetical protein Hanom_Chr14g01273371 [Helianthus anomalus]